MNKIIKSSLKIVFRLFCWCLFVALCATSGVLVGVLGITSFWPSFWIGVAWGLIIANVPPTDKLISFVWGFEEFEWKKH